MDTNEKQTGVARPATRSWRRHSDEFKARVIEMARQPNTSVAAVALANGLNANMLRRWVRQCEHWPALHTASQHGSAMTAFVPLSLPAQCSTTTPPPQPTTVDVQILHRQTKVLVSLPLTSSGAAWLREVLR